MTRTDYHGDSRHVKRITARAEVEQKAIKVFAANPRVRGPVSRTKGINETMAKTLAACGDVNRNVMAPANPRTSEVTPSAFKMAEIVDELRDYSAGHPSREPGSTLA